MRYRVTPSAPLAQILAKFVSARQLFAELVTDRQFLLIRGCLFPAMKRGNPSSEGS
jgi:hypothetical protein